MKTHEENIKIYLENGGDIKVVNRYLLPTVQNRAKISYLLSKLDMKVDSSKINLDSSVVNMDTPKVVRSRAEPSKPTFLGFISQYPRELHSVYQDCYNAWLSVCRLKIELNATAPLDLDAAYELQTKLIKSIKSFDRHKKALDYWLENKRILPIESKKDYSKFSQLELDQERRNLASLITRRKQTILKKEKELPTPEALDYRKKMEAIQLKKEQLEELILDQNKIVELLTV